MAVVAAGAVLLTGGGGTSPELAIAQAINLRATDLPGFAAQAATANAAGSQIQARARRCPGMNGLLGHPGEVNASSPQFASGSGLSALQVQSSASIERSTSVATGDLAQAHSGRLGSCLVQVFNGLTIPTSNGIPVTSGNVHVTALPATALGMNGSFGMRVQMTLSAAGRSLPTTMDFFGYAVGRDELGLMAFAIERPFPAAAEHRLSALLVGRALARPH